MRNSTERLVVALDADDTLWSNEDHFRQTEADFLELIAPYCPGRTHEDLARDLLEIERTHLGIYGFGVKGFTLSMIEAATTLTNGSVTNNDIERVLQLGKDLLQVPTVLLAGVEEAVAELASHYRLLLITKGDLRHQQSKIDESGLTHHFESTHVVSDKSPREYRTILNALDVDPTEFIMVGNSLKSDVLPVIELGGVGIHIPYHLTWEVETATVPQTLDVPTLTTLAEVHPYLQTSHPTYLAKPETAS